MAQQLGHRGKSCGDNLAAVCRRSTDVESAMRMDINRVTYQQLAFFASRRAVQSGVPTIPSFVRRTGLEGRLSMQFLEQTDCEVAALTPKHIVSTNLSKKHLEVQPDLPWLSIGISIHHHCCLICPMIGCKSIKSLSKARFHNVSTLFDHIYHPVLTYANLMFQHVSTILNHWFQTGGINHYSKISTTATAETWSTQIWSKGTSRDPLVPSASTRRRLASGSGVVGAASALLLGSSSWCLGKLIG